VWLPSADPQEVPVSAGPPNLSPGTPPTAVHRDLLGWFAAQRRDLPWRRQRSLYGTWISEMMLQQTTVATVVPYWERFLERFPDVTALAAAPEDEVLALWSGLGYYRRARQLHAAARQVVSEREGVLPTDLDGWRRLPGIGSYAAGAIASLGLGLCEPAVDANVRRVLGRWLAGPDPSVAPTPRAIEARARELMPRRHPGDWNEALMELGAVLCHPRRPSCAACPVAAHCGAARAGLAWSPPPAVARPAPVAVRALLVAIVCRDRVWLEPSGGGALRCPAAEPPLRDDFSRLHPGLLTLPMSAWYPSPGRHAGGLPAGLTLPWRPFPDQPEAGFPQVVGRFRHAITRYRLSVEVVVLRVGFPGTVVEIPAPSGRPAGSWVGMPEAGQLHVSQLARKALRCFDAWRG
jgi:A/G-specific adenine glycosylase